jgi:prolipoprotein diacylglyceryltransferase
MRLHDTRGVRVRRWPVQYFEMFWWALGTVAFVWVWPLHWPAGSYAAGVLAWYGTGRAVLEPLRHRIDVVFGRLPVNQLVAAGLAAAGWGFLLFRIGDAA